MNCQEIIDKIFDFIDNEMDGKTIAQLKKHLDLCHDCFNRVEFEKALRENLKKKTNHCCPDKLRAKIQTIIDKF